MPCNITQNLMEKIGAVNSTRES